MAKTEDMSLRCKSESEDPIGLRRSWHSNTQVTIEGASIWRVDTVIDELGQSFVDQGWILTPVAAHERPARA